MTARKKPVQPPRPPRVAAPRAPKKDAAVLRREHQRAAWKKRVRAAVKRALDDDSIDFLLFTPTLEDPTKIEVFSNISNPRRMLAEVHLAEGRIAWEMAGGQVINPLLPAVPRDAK